MNAGVNPLSSQANSAQPLFLKLDRSAALLGKWSVYAYAAFPIVNRAISISFLRAYANSWSTILLCLMALVGLYQYKRSPKLSAFAWSKFGGLFILYCVALFFSQLGLPHVAFDGLSMNIEYLLFALLLPFVIQEKDIPKMIFTSVVVSILLGFDGVFQYITKVPIPSGWVDVGEHVRTRVFSVYGSPAELAANMELMIPVIAGLFCLDKNRRRRILYMIGEFCCLATLLFTYDRGAWLGLALGLLLISLFYDRRLLVLLIILCAILFFLPPIHHRLADLLSPTYWIQSAKGGRIMRWETAFNRMSRNPLFGVGLGQYGGAIASAYGYSIYSDNYYAKILGETGLVGLLLFSAMHIAIIREVIQTVVRKAQGRQKYLALGGLAGLVALLVHAFFENLFEYAPTETVYFLISGLLILWGRTLDSQKTDLRNQEDKTPKES